MTRAELAALADDPEAYEPPEPPEPKLRRPGLQRRPHSRRGPARKQSGRGRLVLPEARYQALRMLVFARAGWRCERCGIADGPRNGLQAHHRKLRSQGGNDEACNLAALCAECHAWCHRYPVKAQPGGWIVPSWADPSRRPLFMHDGRVALVDNAGGYDLAA